MIHREQFEIKNKAKIGDIQIFDIFSSSPEIFVLEQSGEQFQFPIILRPGESVKVTIVIIPETLELIQAAIHVAFGSDYIFMLPVSLYVTDNLFGLRPIYYSNVNVFLPIKTKISIFNPTEHDIVLQKAYSTEDFVTLKWLS